MGEYSYSGKASLNPLFADPSAYRKPISEIEVCGYLTLRVKKFPLLAPIT